MRSGASAPGKRPLVKAKKKGKKATKAKAAPGDVSKIVKPEDKPEPRIVAFFGTNPREVAANEVATALGLKIQTVNLVLSKLAHQNKIQKLSSGHFKALGAVAG
jgi:predicted Rossmann fold nucleotide-binding protein DprA/Smf involved in DNA uptake